MEMGATIEGVSAVSLPAPAVPFTASQTGPEPLPPPGRKGVGRPRRREGTAFEGLPPAAFSFFAGLAGHNTHEWFSANTAVYREAVDRPWRALAAAAARQLGTWLPDLDTSLRVGHVLSRINMQWPKPGAAYRTGLRAAFGQVGVLRPLGAALLLSLDAGGVRAGTEVLAGTAQWARAMRALEVPGPVGAQGYASLAWTVAGEPSVEGEVLARMQGLRRRGSLRLAATWSAQEAAALGPRLEAAVLEALWGSIPLYLAAAGAGRGAALAGLDGTAPAAPAPPAPPAERGPDAERLGRCADLCAAALVAEGPGREARLGAQETPDPWPALPRALRAALEQRAAAEGVPLHTFLVFALTRAAAG